MVKVCAYIWTFNELDFITWTIRHLLAQGIDIRIFDNWSTDGTYKIAKEFSSQIRCERWPAYQESCSSLTSRLQFLESLAVMCDNDWIIHHDVDEIRRTRTGETLGNAVS